MPLVNEPINCDVSVKRAIRGISKKLGYTGQPIFAGLTLYDLTETRVLFAGAGGVIADDAGLIYALATDILTAGTFNATDEDNALQIDGNTVLKIGDSAQQSLFVGVNCGTIGLGSAAVNNFAIGLNSMTKLTTADGNVAIGTTALEEITTGLNNFALGVQALNNLTTGIQNIAVGLGAGFALTTADSNLFVGTNAGQETDQGENVYIGTKCGQNMRGRENVGIGTYALLASTSTQKNQNTAIGYAAGADLISGSLNVFLGFSAGRTITTDSNLLIIDNRNRGSIAAVQTNALIYGTFNSTPLNQSIRLNVGNLSVVSGTPYQYLINDTHEDTDGGRESRINFKGEQSGGELTTLARIEVGHDGATDDEKGKLVISVNDGDDVNTPTQALEIGSDLLATFAGSIVSANYTAANLLTVCATNAGVLDFSAASKTLTVEDNAIVSQDYSSNASPQFTGIELGHVTDTTITRVSAGVIAVEGVNVMLVGASPTAHNIAFHSDTTATGAELNTLTDGSETTLHSHVDGGFGVWNDRDKDGSGDTVSNNTVYLAATDGLVIVLNGINAETLMYTDSSNPPTTIRWQKERPSGDYAPGIMPVRSGDYWKVTGAQTVYWMPIGQ